MTTTIDISNTDTVSACGAAPESEFGWLRSANPQPRTRTFTFESRHTDLHPPESPHTTDITLQALVAYYQSQNPCSARMGLDALRSADGEVPENQHFTYQVVLPPGNPETGTAIVNGTRRGDRATVLFHGLNEKSWEKYEPWAERLAADTGRPVILFPLAFHMNRAPASWANAREMIGVSRERKTLFPGLRSSSFANAALSHRLQFAPHRFLTSGLQSYYDALDLARQITRGEHSLFDRGTRLDFFGFSIGASLAELLVLTDADGLFSQSRTVLFCGGAVMDHASPVSRMIVDEAAAGSLRTYLEALAASPETALPRGVRSIQADLPELTVFRSLVSLDVLRNAREETARRCKGRITAIAMKDDPVFPPEGIEASWTTADGGCLIPVHTLDPPYKYTHENPLPRNSGDAQAVEAAMDEVFSRAAEHLG